MKETSNLGKKAINSRVRKMLTRVGTDTAQKGNKKN